MGGGRGEGAVSKLFKSQLSHRFFLRPFEEVPRGPTEPGLTEPACAGAPQKGTTGKWPSLLPPQPQYCPQGPPRACSVHPRNWIPQVAARGAQGWSEGSPTGPSPVLGLPQPRTQAKKATKWSWVGGLGLPLRGMDDGERTQELAQGGSRTRREHLLGCTPVWELTWNTSPSPGPGRRGCLVHLHPPSQPRKGAPRLCPRAPLSQQAPVLFCTVLPPAAPSPADLQCPLPRCPPQRTALSCHLSSLALSSPPPQPLGSLGTVIRPQMVMDACPVLPLPGPAVSLQEHVPQGGVSCPQLLREESPLHGSPSSFPGCTWFSQGDPGDPGDTSLEPETRVAR